MFEAFLNELARDFLFCLIGRILQRLLFAEIMLGERELGVFNFFV